MRKVTKPAAVIITGLALSFAASAKEPIAIPQFDSTQTCRERMTHDDGTSKPLTMESCVRQEETSKGVIQKLAGLDEIHYYLWKHCIYKTNAGMGGYATLEGCIRAEFEQGAYKQLLDSANSNVSRLDIKK